MSAEMWDGNVAELDVIAARCPFLSSLGESVLADMKVELIAQQAEPAAPDPGSEPHERVLRPTVIPLETKHSKHVHHKEADTVPAYQPAATAELPDGHFVGVLPVVELPAGPRRHDSYASDNNAATELPPAVREYNQPQKMLEDEVLFANQPGLSATETYWPTDTAPTTPSLGEPTRSTTASAGESREIRATDNMAAPAHEHTVTTIRSVASSRSFGRAPKRQQLQIPVRHKEHDTEQAASAYLSTSPEEIYDVLPQADDTTFGEAPIATYIADSLPATYLQADNALGVHLENGYLDVDSTSVAEKSPGETLLGTVNEHIDTPDNNAKLYAIETLQHLIDTSQSLAELKAQPEAAALSTKQAERQVSDLYEALCWELGLEPDTEIAAQLVHSMNKPEFIESLQFEMVQPPTDIGMHERLRDVSAAISTHLPKFHPGRILSRLILALPVAA